MARPVDYRKSRGSKGVHTADEQVAIGKKDQAHNLAAKNQKADMPNLSRRAPPSQGKHSTGHQGQKPKRRV